MTYLHGLEKNGVKNEHGNLNSRNSYRQLIDDECNLLK